MVVEKQLFGRLADGHEVDLFTLRSGETEVKVTNYGGIITSIICPDKEGNYADVVHGFHNFEQYLRGHPYFGCIIGRYANRIADGRFALDYIEYKLHQNDGKNHLHGGLRGFDKVLWDAKVEKGLKLNYLSPDGEEGYPGDLNVSVAYDLSKKGELTIEYEATTNKKTIINLTNHSYFNLRASGDILDHEIAIDADFFTLTGPDLIPTGEIESVYGTPLDFRKPKAIKKGIDNADQQILYGKGYDHNLILNGEPRKLRPVATLRDPISDRMMEIRTTQPGIQLYTGNFLDGTMTGKGRVYTRRSGLCLETQHFPDSPNHANFPSTLLMPGSRYREKTTYRFYVG